MFKTKPLYFRKQRILVIQFIFFSPHLNQIGKIQISFYPALLKQELLSIFRLSAKLVFLPIPNFLVS
jgi:hypothetical protein